MKQTIKIADDLFVINEKIKDTVIISPFYKGVPCPCFIHETKKSNKLCELYSMKFDLEYATNYINKLNKNYNEDDELIKNSFWRSVVLYYNRCFSGPSKHGEDKGRGSKIEIEKIKLTNEELEIHERMIYLRHKYLAHAGSSSDMYRYAYYVILNPDPSRKKILNSFVWSADAKGYSPIDHFEKLKDIIAKIDSYLDDRIKKLMHHIHIEINKIDIKKKYLK